LADRKTGRKSREARTSGSSAARSGRPRAQFGDLAGGLEALDHGETVACETVAQQGKRFHRTHVFLRYGPSPLTA